MTGFENCVVIKPWGREYQVFDNGCASVWMLCIKPGQGTSVHCHFGKTARFVAVEGEAMVRTNSILHRLKFPDWANVEPYEFHAVGNPGDRDLWLVEIENPSDKADLFRLRDKYGRGQGYESGDSLIRDDLSRFDHFMLEEGFPYEEHRRSHFQISGGFLRIEQLGGKRFSQMIYDSKSAEAA